MGVQPLSRSGRLSRVLAAGAAALLVALAVPASGQAIAMNCLVPAGHTVATSTTPLRFGIYPGGPAGSVNPKARPRPEDHGKRLAALQTLAGANPFVVRLYSAWTGNRENDDVSGWLDAEIAGYTAAGFQVELVVRYKPAAADAGSSPSAFADHVREIVRRYGRDPRVVFLQVTNEANLPGAPAAADGAFAGAAEALVEGVIAAKDQARRDARGQLRIGFSWAYDERPEAASGFWALLGRLGGRRFADAVDWVGLDSYPGTWGPQVAPSDLMPGHAADAMKQSVRALRDCMMPLAGLGDATALHIAENGFPTGPGRSEELQSQVLDAMVRNVDAIRGLYGVTDYRWFDLRDSSSADPNMESQYGITRDDYSPKPAFTTYRDLVDRFSGGGPRRARPASCRLSPIKVTLPRWKSTRLTSLVVRVGSRVVRPARRSRVPRAVRISMASGRSAVKLKLTSEVHGRRLTHVVRRMYRVC